MSSPGKKRRRSTVGNGLKTMTQSTGSEQDSDEDVSDTEDDGSDEFMPESDSSDASQQSEDDMEEDMKGIVDFSAKEWISKNKKIVWSRSNAETLPYMPSPCVTLGPTPYAVARITTVTSCFSLLFTEEIKQYILNKTNQQGRRSVKNWKDIDMIELDAYIGLLILAGVYRARNESTKNLWDEHTGRAIFRATMSKNRYNLISANMRFEEKTTQSARHRNDKLWPIRTIWDKWSERLPLLFNPGRDVCVDEQLLAFRGHCGFRQHMPSKPAKCGLKIWVTCDVATSYVWKMQIYTGEAADGAPEVNQGKRVVLDMTEGLKGNTVTCDHFFTSYELAEELLKKKITLVGRIRSSKSELPPQLRRIKDRASRSSLFVFTKTHTLVSYISKGKRSVLVLSTKHREPAMSHKKPKIILDYNSCKGSVDFLDKRLSTYSCKRKTSRWPLVIFFNMLDVSAYNAYVLWKDLNPTWDKSHSKNHSYERRLFLEELGKLLVTSNMIRRTRLPKVPAAAAIVEDLRCFAPVESEELVTKKTRMSCKFCNFRRRTRTSCVICGFSICKLHTVTICSVCYNQKVTPV